MIYPRQDLGSGRRKLLRAGTVIGLLRLWGGLCCLLVHWPAACVRGEGASTVGSQVADLQVRYRLDRVASEPWAIHIVEIPRAEGRFQLQTTHADGGALGLEPLTAQITRAGARFGRVVAAVNGDYYVRQGEFAGDPRGMQVVDGEVISLPAGAAVFWLDVDGHPQAGEIQNASRVIWPDGTQTPAGLNGQRTRDAVEVYTPAVGNSAPTSGGREIRLEAVPGGPWMPWRMGRSYRARVAEVREAGGSAMQADTVILSAAPALAGTLPAVRIGNELLIHLEASPRLQGVRAAIGGGPVLVAGGRAQRIRIPDSESYEFRSMAERHPRSAIGWNERAFYFVSVDGRQPGWSVGMTLRELGGYLARLGCEGAMNLDGGGSATLWHDGKIVNRPCDGYERSVANAVIVVDTAPRPLPPPSPQP